jgi:hypothetical protein
MTFLEEERALQATRAVAVVSSVAPLSPNMKARLMPETIYPLIYWPVGIALGGWLFFEIAKRM